MAEKKHSQALLPLVFIVVMVASLLLPIGAFFGFFMQKKSLYNKLEQEYKKNADELRIRIDELSKGGKLKAKDKKISDAFGRLKTWFCKSKEEADRIYMRFKDHLSGDDEFVIKSSSSVTKAKIRIFSDTETTEAFAYKFNGVTTIKGLWRIFTEITSIGRPCLICQNKKCELFAKPIFEMAGKDYCVKCKQVLRRSFEPKFSFIEKFELKATSKTGKIGGRHKFDITLVLPYNIP